MKTLDIAEKIWEAIAADLFDRRGLDNEWDEINPQIKKLIKRDNILNIKAVLEKVISDD